MPPTPQKITGPSHSSSPTAKARNSVERDKAEAALLKVWPNLGSLDELVPPDVTPPFWGKPLLASLGLLARQKTLREARNLLLDQIDRRKQDVASTRKLLATPSPFLAASDVRAILDRLKSSQVLSDLEPAANSIVVATDNTSDSASEEAPSAESPNAKTKDGSVSSPEDEPLVHSRPASRGPTTSKTPDPTSDNAAAPQPINKNMMAYRRSEYPPLDPVSAVGPASPLASPAGMASRPGTLWVSETPGPSASSAARTASSTPANGQKSTGQNRSGAKPNQSTSNKTKSTSSSASRNTNAKTTASQGRSKGGSQTQNQPPSTAAESVSRQATNAHTPSTNNTTTANTTANAAVAAAPPARSPKPPLATFTLATFKLPSSSSEPKPPSASAASPNPSVNGLRTTSSSPSTQRHELPITRRPPPSSSSSQSNAEDHDQHRHQHNHQNNQQQPQKQQHAGQQQRDDDSLTSSTGAERQATSTLQFISQAAFRLTSSTIEDTAPPVEVARGSSLHTKESHSSQSHHRTHSRSESQQRQGVSLSQPPAQRPQPSLSPSRRPVPASVSSPATDQSPAQVQAPAPVSSQAPPTPVSAASPVAVPNQPAQPHPKSKKRKFSEISHERQLREAEFDLEIATVLHKRAKYRADEATKVHEDIHREIAATAERCARLNREAEDMKSRMSALEKDLLHLGKAYPDILGVRPPGASSADNNGNNGTKTSSTTNNDKGTAPTPPFPNGVVLPPSSVDVPGHLTTCFNYLLESIRAQPAPLHAEREAASRALSDLEAELVSAQTEMQRAAAEEQAKQAEVNEHGKVLERLLGR